MPIYAYRCDTCGFRKDVLQKMSDPVLTTCPACSAESFAKQLSAPAFQLKGTGWYVTDFRDKGKKAGDGAETGRIVPASENGASGTEAASNGAAGNGSDKGSDKGADKGSDRGAEKSSGKKADAAPAAGASAPAAQSAGGASPPTGGGSGAS